MKCKCGQTELRLERRNKSHMEMIRAGWLMKQSINRYVTFWWRVALLHTWLTTCEFMFPVHWYGGYWIGVLQENENRMSPWLWWALLLAVIVLHWSNSRNLIEDTVDLVGLAHCNGNPGLHWTVINSFHWTGKGDQTINNYMWRLIRFHSTLSRLT